MAYGELKNLKKILIVFLGSMFLTGCGLFSAVTCPFQQRGTKAYCSDNNLRASLNRELISGQCPQFKGVQFLVHNGRVLLMGLVSNDQVKNQIVSFVNRFEGVRQVIDEIEIGNQGTGDYADDAWLGHKITTALFLDPHIFSQNYHVCVVNRIAYILGSTTSKQQKAQVIAKSESFSVRSVIDHIEIVTAKEKVSGVGGQAESNEDKNMPQLCPQPSS